jgi:hypothetical protein
LDRKDLKKISFSLHLGFVGLHDSGKNIILDFFKERSIETNYTDRSDNENVYEFFLVFKQIPIKLKVFLAEDIKSLILDHKIIKRLDAMILALNLYNLSSKNKYFKEELIEFIEIYGFNGMSALIGLDIELISGKDPSKEFRISRYNLVQKAKELDVLYCFEILNKKNDLLELYNKILGDFTFKFQFTNPEILEKAKEYGKTIINQ